MVSAVTSAARARNQLFQCREQYIKYASDLEKLMTRLSRAQYVLAVTSEADARRQSVRDREQY